MQKLTLLSVIRLIKIHRYLDEDSKDIYESRLFDEISFAVYICVCNVFRRYARLTAIAVVNDRLVYRPHEGQRLICNVASKPPLKRAALAELRREKSAAMYSVPVNGLSGIHQVSQNHYCAAL